MQLVVYLDDKRTVYTLMVMYRYVLSVVGSLDPALPVSYVRVITAP